MENFKIIYNVMKLDDGLKFEDLDEDNKILLLQNVINLVDQKIKDNVEIASNDAFCRISYMMFVGSGFGVEDLPEETNVEIYYKVFDWVKLNLQIN